MSAPQVPQVNDLALVRRAVAAVSADVGRDELAARLHVPDSRISHVLAAARVMGWLADDGRVTETGRRLLELPEGSERERAWMADCLRASPLVTVLVPGLLDGTQDVARIAGRLRRAGGLSASTAERRASVLVDWRRQVTQPQLALIPEVQLDGDLVRSLRRDNPWWVGEPGRVLPKFQRTFLADMWKRMHAGLAPIVVVRGARQIGKTTAQLQAIERLLAEGVAPRRILRVQFDDLPTILGTKEPILRIVEWYEQQVLGRSLNVAAHGGEPAWLFFDEVQNLDRWPEQLKHLVDSSTVRVVVTGSSALRIERGRDSLAGRMTSLDPGTLGLSEIAGIRGRTLPPLWPPNGPDCWLRRETWPALRAHAERHGAELAEAFRAFSARGGYPLGHERPDVPWSDLADQLNENVVKRVIQHDLRLGDHPGRRRDARLLEEVFRLVCRYSGQAPSVAALTRELRDTMGANVGAQRVAQYIDFLHQAMLVRKVEPLELRLKRKKEAPRLCLADHGLRASWLQELVPLDPAGLDAVKDLELHTLAGHLVEGVVGSWLSAWQGLDVSWFPERGAEPEVDFVVTIGVHRVPIEVKYRRRIEPRDWAGLVAFTGKRVYGAPYGLLVTRTDSVVPPVPPEIEVVPLPALLLLR